MNKSRFVLALVFIGALLISTVAIVSGGQDKVPVCHITGTYDFDDGHGEVPIGHVITIADPAYQSHLAHGDPEVWETVEIDGVEVCRPGEDTKIVFVTSHLYTPIELESMENADSLCMCCALNASVQLQGIFKAWLSTNHVSASSRLTHSPGPYVLVDGTIIAEDWYDLTNNLHSLKHSISIDESNSTIDSPYEVWTGVFKITVDGTKDINEWSDDWSFGTYGLADSTSFTWTIAPTIIYPISDQTSYRVYCFEQ